MTMALPAQAARPSNRFDLSWPILILFAALLCVLIVLPMSWLIYYSLVDRNGAFTLDNFARLVTDDAFLDPLITTVVLATSSSLACCVAAAPMSWLVARTDMPLRRMVRALVTASFVTPPFLGAIAWELLAAPNSGLINKFWRVLTGMPQDEYLFNIYSLPGLIFVISCYTFPYVFVLMANALDRIPGDLEDASSILGGRTWTTARRVTIPLVLPALLAGALVAFLQAMTLFGSPAILAIPAGFHTMTTKIWSLFNYPPKPELAAAASVPLLVLTVLLLRAEHLILGRRGYSVVGGKQGNPRLVPLGGLKWLALAFVFVVLMCPVFLPYGALLNAAFSKVATTWAFTPSFDLHFPFVHFKDVTAHNIYFVFFELSATKLAVYNTFVLGFSAATVGTVMALVIAYLTTRRAIKGYRTLGFLATAPVAIPGIVLGVGLFLSYARPPLVLYGTLWILLIAFITIALPSAYQQLQSAFRTVHVDLEEASRILGATRLRTLWGITAPLLRTSVIATWCFIFVGVIRELSAAIMLFTSETKVISVLIFDLNESGDLGAISVLGIIMLVITFAVVIAVNRIPGFGDTRLRT
jgi:iron(III) transport system permease protein